METLGIIPRIQLQLDSMRRGLLNENKPRYWLIDSDGIKVPTQAEIHERHLGALTALAEFESWLMKNL